MDDRIMDYKKRKKYRKGKFPFLLFAAFFTILIVMLLSVTAQNTAQKTQSSNTKQTGDKTEESKNAEDKDTPILAVLKEIDTGSGSITFMNTENGQDIIVNFTGAADITDKYDKIISASQLNPGEMADIYYNRDASMLKKLQISNRAWEYKGVTRWKLDQEEDSFLISESRYKISDNLFLVKDGQQLTLNDLNSKDELEVKGYDRQVWSILVTKGHGTIRFEDYKDFIGGTVYIGNQEILPIVSDMSVIVREGSYKVTMEKGSLKGNKNLQVLPFEETVLNMGEFELPPVQKGTVKFNIIPEGADLYINDDLTDYSKAVELEYGEYNIKAALGGYMNYTGKLEVEGNKIVSIELVENQSRKEDGSGNTRDASDKDNNSQTDTNTKAADKDGEKTAEEDSSNGYTEVKADNNIYIQEPEGTSVYFDGQFKGTVPVSFPKETGPHYVTLIRSGYQTKTYSVEIKDDGEDVKLNFSDLDKKE